MINEEKIKQKTKENKKILPVSCLLSIKTSIHLRDVKETGCPSAGEYRPEKEDRMKVEKEGEVGEGEVRNERRD